jgi:hypothetical protein
MFEVVENAASGTVIKVIGVGGANGAPSIMIPKRRGRRRVHHRHTDGQALSRTQAKEPDPTRVVGARRSQARSRALRLGLANK